MWGKQRDIRLTNLEISIETINLLKPLKILIRQTTVDVTSAYLAVGPAVVVDVGRGSQPELGTVFPTRVHDGKVIFAGDQKAALFWLAQLGDATNQQRDLVALVPRLGGANLGSHLTLLRVTVASLDHDSRATVEKSQISDQLTKETIKYASVKHESFLFWKYSTLFYACKKLANLSNLKRLNEPYKVKVKKKMKLTTTKGPESEFKITVSYWKRSLLILFTCSLSAACQAFDFLLTCDDNQSHELNNSAKAFS